MSVVPTIRHQLVCDRCHLPGPEGAEVAVLRKHASLLGWKRWGTKERNQDICPECLSEQEVGTK